MRWLTWLVVAVLLHPALLLDAATAAAAPRQSPPCSRGLVALTFDDGPSDTVTEPLTRLLRRERVPATFFMVGSRVAAHPEIVRLVERRGFAIGNHTWAHTDMTTQSGAELRAAITSTQTALLEAGVSPTELVRPPYGAIDDRARRVIDRLGLVPVLWTVDSRDWAGRSPKEIREAIVSAVRPHRTNLVLQHDGVGNSPATLQALRGEIETLRKRGYCFAPLDQTGVPTPPEPVVSVSAGRPRVGEGQAVRLTVRLDRPTSRPTAVRIESEDRLADRTLRFAVGQTTARLLIRMPQDSVDRHGDRLVLHPVGTPGTRTGPPLLLGIVDDDPAPTVTVGSATVRASPLLERTARLAVRLDRASDRDVEVIARSPFGPARTTVPAGSRRGELALTVPVGRPRDGVREVRVRVQGSTPATLVVRPPARTRAEAIRAVVAEITWPEPTVPRLFPLSGGYDRP